MSENTRPFIQKIVNDAREYVQSLLDENKRLHDLLAGMQEENRRASARYVEVEQQNTNLANLYVASYQLHGTLHRERVLNAIKEIIINLIGSEELGVWEVNDGYLTLIDSFGLDDNEWAAIPAGAPSMIARVAASGETFVASNTMIALEGREKNLTAYVPLKLDDDVIAVIGIFTLLQQKEGLEPVDHELFDLLATHGATALHCTKLAAGAAQ